MKLDLDNDNVRLVTLSVSEVRDNVLDVELPGDLSLALDEAQGQVFTDAETVSYVVIKISK